MNTLLTEPESKKQKIIHYSGRGYALQALRCGLECALRSENFLSVRGRVSIAHDKRILEDIDFMYKLSDMDAKIRQQNMHEEFLHDHFENAIDRFWKWLEGEGIFGMQTTVQQECYWDYLLKNFQQHELGNKIMEYISPDIDDYQFFLRTFKPIFEMMSITYHRNVYMYWIYPSSKMCNFMDKLDHLARCRMGWGRSWVTAYYQYVYFQCLKCMLRVFNAGLSRILRGDRIFNLNTIRTKYRRMEHLMLACFDAPVMTYVFAEQLNMELYMKTISSGDVHFTIGMKHRKVWKALQDFLKPWGIQFSENFLFESSPHVLNGSNKYTFLDEEMSLLLENREYEI